MDQVPIVSCIPKEGIKIIIYVFVHNDSLDLGNEAVVTRFDFLGDHKSNTDSDGFSLGGHEYDFFVSVDIVFISKDTWNHEFSSITDRVDSGVFDDDSLEGDEETFQWEDDSSKIRFVTELFESVLSTLQVVHSDHILVLRHDTRSVSSKFFHMGGNTEFQTDVDTESSDVGTGLALDPKQTESVFFIIFDKSIFIDGSNSEFSLDGSDDGWLLEAWTSKGIKSLDDSCFTSLDLVMESNDTDILFTGLLLSLSQSSSSVNTDDQTARNFRIQST